MESIAGLINSGVVVVTISSVLSGRSGRHGS
jgi:hypothetical protein